MKECSTCKNLFPLDSFKSKSCKCKSCVKNTYTKWRLENPEKMRKYRETEKPKSATKARLRYKEDVEYREKQLQKRKEEYRKNPYKKLLSGAKRRSALLNLPFNLTVEDLEVPTHCPVFGFLLQISEGQPSDNSPSLDRIIPSKGYTKENVRIISYLANRMKSDASPEMLLIFSKWILKEQSIESFSENK